MKVGVRLGGLTTVGGLGLGRDDDDALELCQELMISGCRRSTSARVCGGLGAGLV